MKVIATDIANLTDARYFAAWGVEAMAYNIDSSGSDSLSMAQLKEITDWVEGPETMIKMEGLAIPDNLEEVNNNLEIHGAIIGPFIEADTLPSFNKVLRICTIEDGWQDADQLILTYPSAINNASDQTKEQIKSINEGKEVYLDASFTANDLDLITSLGFSGIILKGGAEEKVGFKSYEDLDEILETIYDNF